VDTTPPKRNPLLLILIGFLVAAFFNIQFYFVQHRLIGLGSAAIGAIAVFFVLFFLRSRWAWLAAILALAVLAVVMLLTYQGGYMGFPLTWPVAIIDLVLFVVFVGYVFRIRKSYLRYVAAKEI
jgi:hypothetical protein